MGIPQQGRCAYVSVCVCMSVCLSVFLCVCLPVSPPAHFCLLPSAVLLLRACADACAPACVSARLLVLCLSASKHVFCVRLTVNVLVSFRVPVRLSAGLCDLVHILAHVCVLFLCPSIPLSFPVARPPTQLFSTENLRTAPAGSCCGSPWDAARTAWLGIPYRSAPRTAPQTASRTDLRPLRTGASRPTPVSAPRPAPPYISAAAAAGGPEPPP